MNSPTNITLTNSTPYQEERLLLRIAEGDETALKDLLYAYSDHLGAFVYKITGNREVTQEIVQDVFMKLWQKRDNLGKVDRLHHYLFIITRNLTYNYIRNTARSAVRYRQWLQEMENMETVSNMTDEEEHLGQYLPLIDAAVDRLPEQQKKVFDLAKKQGLSRAQIADEMGISAETVKKYMKLAIQSIRKQLQNQAPPSLLLILYLITGNK